MKNIVTEQNKMIFLGLVFTLTLGISGGYFTFLITSIWAIDKGMAVWGFFQYPNTYAIFMLVCMITAFHQIDWKHLDWFLVVHVIAGIAGIYLSGSRTVFIILALYLFFLIFQKKESRKIMLIGVGAGGIGILALALLGIGAELLERFGNISFGASTLLGRFLYYIDALPVILKHPFGLGYYGYYSIQQEIQTGVYSVLNVHNELLQFMLDIGIIPTLLFYGYVGKIIFDKRTSNRDRQILLVLFAHSLLDYDFQFLAMMFVVVLFLPSGNSREYVISSKMKIVGIVLSI